MATVNFATYFVICADGTENAVAATSPASAIEYIARDRKPVGVELNPSATWCFERGLNQFGYDDTMDCDKWEGFGI